VRYIAPHSHEAPRTGFQRTIPAELPPGEYVLRVSVEANEEDGADYYFRIVVE